MGIFLIARIALVRPDAELRTVPPAVVLPALGDRKDVVHSNIGGSIRGHRPVVQSLPKLAPLVRS